MHTIQDPAGPVRKDRKPTLIDWINAQRAVRDEEERLKALAMRNRRHHGADDVERQRVRVQLVQDVADAIYDVVMQDLRMA